MSAARRVAFVLAYRYLPRGGTYAPEGRRERGSFGVIVRDRPFLLFLASGMLAWLVYVAFEVVLPVSLTNTHGLEPAAWGFLVIVNPLMVTFFQLRLTRRVAARPAGGQARGRDAADGPAVPAAVGERRRSRWSCS